MITASKFANLFPMLRQEELKELAQDIKEHGLRRKIVLHRGEILDGRNRHAACQIAGVEPEFEEYQGDDPYGFVISENIMRRHLTDGQRAAVLADWLESKGEGRAKAGAPKGNRNASKTTSSIAEIDSMKPSSPPAPVSRAAVAKSAGVSVATMDRATKVIRDGTKEVAAAVRDGHLTLGAASTIVTLPKEEQAALMAAGPVAVRKKATEMRGISKAEPAAEFTLEVVEEAATTDAAPAKDKPFRYIPEDGKSLWVMARTNLDRILPNDLHLKEVMCQTISYCVKRAVSIIKPPGKKRGNMLPQYQPDQADEIWQMARATLRRILPSDKSRERVLLEMIDYCVRRLEAGE